MAGRPRKLGPEDQNRILELRDQHGMTLAAIAKEYSVGIATVSRICSLGSGTQTALRRTNEPSGTANTDSGSVGDTKVANRHIGNRETSSWKPGGNETGTEPPPAEIRGTRFQDEAMESNTRNSTPTDSATAESTGQASRPVLSLQPRDGGQKVYGDQPDPNLHPPAKRSTDGETPASGHGRPTNGNLCAAREIRDTSTAVAHALEQWRQTRAQEDYVRVDQALADIRRALAKAEVELWTWQ